MIALQWAVDELKRLGSQPLTFDEYVNVDELADEHSEIRQISPVRVKGHVTVTKTLISFHLHISGKMVLPCSLTLVDVDYPFSIETIESFQLNEHIQIDEADNEYIHPVDGQFIDLKPIIKENVLLSIPMKVVHPDAKITESGEGWEFITGEKKKDAIDPRMAKLAEFFNKDKRE